MLKNAPKFFLLFLLLGAPVRALEWQVSRFEGRDYVPVEQVGEFYRLPKDASSTAVRPVFKEGDRFLAFAKGSREVLIHGVRHWLAFAVIEQDSKLWVSRMDLSKTLEPALRPELVRGLKAPTRVILDAGHGGADKGAVSVYQFEKNFALDMARRVRDALVAKGVKVEMTRNSDTFVELSDRAAFANARPDAIFVSLHFNSAANRAAQGFEIFCVTPRGAPSTEYEDLLVRDMVKEHGNESEVASFVLASSIYHAMHGNLQMMDRGVKRSRFAVLRMTKIPAVLVEGGFLSNPVDARRIASPQWRTRYARAIAEGILAYIRLTRTGQAPPLASEYRMPGTRVLDAPMPTPLNTTPSLNLRKLPDGF